MAVLVRGLGLLLGIGGLVVLPSAAADAAAGELDPDYGKGGVAVPRWSDTSTAGTAAAGQTDGKVVVVGRHDVSGDGGDEWAIARLTVNGHKDDTFNGTGLVTQALGPGDAVAQAVMVDAEGRIVVAGTGHVGAQVHGFLVRYLTTGAPDTGFGDEGVVDLGPLFFPTSVAPRPDFGIAVGGATQPDEGTPMVARIDAVTSSGEPDTSFDDDGTAVYPQFVINTGYSEIHALLGRADGSLVFGGNATFEDGGEGCLFGYVNADGKVTGWSIHRAGGATYASVRALAEGPGDTAVAAGFSDRSDPAGDRFVVIRFDERAVQDDTFGDEGVVVDAMADDGDARAYGVAVGEDGQVLVGGTVRGGFALARYLEDGTRDPDFGEAGAVLTPVGDSGEARAQVLFAGLDRVVLGGTIGQDIGAVRYLDALGTPSVPVTPVASVADTSVTEGTGGSTSATVTVSLSPAPSGPVSVGWATSAGSATAGTDYTTSSGTASFAAGQTSTTVSVPVVPDAVDEPDETFTVTLSSPVGVTIGDGSATVTILDDDAPPTTVSIQDATAVPEGGTLQFPVVLNQASASTITVDVATADGSATQPGDYAATTQTLSFTPGTTSLSFDVTTTADLAPEADETVQASITGTSGPVAVDDPAAVGTIHDGPPAAAIGTAAAVEGGNLVFPVSLSKAAPGTITLRLVTEDGTAVAPGDYTAVPGPGTTLTFPPGTTSQSFVVSTTSDSTVEPDETMKARITGGSGSVATPQLTAVGTITDGTPSAAIGAATATEGGNLVFPVTLSKPATGTITLRLGTQDGTAVAPGDYTAIENPGTTLTFPPGTTSQTFVVATKSDASTEPDETVQARILGGSGFVATPQLGATGTITDATPVASIGTATAEEGGTLVFAVTLSKAATSTITLRLGTQDGTATGGSDFTAIASPGTTLTFAPGTTSRNFVVATTNDGVAEGDETMRARILGGTGFVATPQLSAVGTIRDPVMVAVPNEHVITGPVTGKVLYKVPGSPDWIELDHLAPLPVGTLLDTLDGTLVIKYAVPGKGRLAASRIQSVKLGGGIAKLAQPRGVPTLTLKGKGARHLTVASKGRVAVPAKYAVATLRQGRLMVSDRAGSTKVAVKKGLAEAAPVKHPKQVRLLRAGQSAVFRG